MNTIKQYLDQQEAIQLQNRISSFMKDFKIGTLLHKNGIRKRCGVSPLTLFSVIFSLPFEGINFSRGIVRNLNLVFKKDAAYDFLKNPRHNWRKFMLALSAIVVHLAHCSSPVVMVAEDITLSLVDSIMSIAIDMVQTGQRVLRNCSAVTGH